MRFFAIHYYSAEPGEIVGADAHIGPAEQLAETRNTPANSRFLTGRCGHQPLLCAWDKTRKGGSWEPPYDKTYGLTESRRAARSKLASNAVSTLMLPSMMPFWAASTVALVSAEAYLS